MCRYRRGLSFPPPFSGHPELTCREPMQPAARHCVRTVVCEARYPHAVHNAGQLAHCRHVRHADAGTSLKNAAERSRKLPNTTPDQVEMYSYLYFESLAFYRCAGFGSCERHRMLANSAVPLSHLHSCLSAALCSAHGLHCP